LWLAGGGRVGRGPTYVLGTFYIHFLVTRATKDGKIVNPAVSLDVTSTVVVGGYAPLPATFLLNSFLSKLAPLTNYMTDSVSSFNSALESVIKVVRGASFDKKEFKRNVAGSGAFPRPLRRVRHDV
jgi:hypothetical protein